ncbi:MAG: hypothetical protein J0H85_04675 [Sediminibacterium magnilacihabitans]|jgi:hypothetical protein|nr:hypothetical protein [Sediminibacterium magnilacihabitans]PQV61800.1 hypothetical protein CLV53_10174 [Sediminibacterium magnilacihabitans]
MDIEIITDTLFLQLHGFGGIAFNKDYASTAFKLSGKMWDCVKSQELKHKGKNIWVYENDDKVFAGIELEVNQPTNSLLEEKKIKLSKYARFT